MNDEREKRRQLKAANKELFEEMTTLLFQHDPIGINFEENTDEYEPEVGTILPRLKDAATTSDVLDIVHEEFVRWFDEQIAGDKEHYREIANDIWKLWRRHTRNE